MSTDTEMATRVRRVPPQDKPEVNLNLDSLAREADSTPFAFVYDGRRYELTHAGIIGAFDIFEAFGQPEPRATIDTLRLAMGSEQFEAFKRANPPFGPMQKLVAAYFEFCGMATGN